MLVTPIPAPWSVTAFPDTLTVEVQVQLPAGTTTVSPVEAELIAPCTFALEQEVALMTAPLAGVGRHTAKQKINELTASYQVLTQEVH